MSLWVAFDLETGSRTSPEFALQPWRAMPEYGNEGFIRLVAYASSRGAHATYLDAAQAREQLSDLLMGWAKEGATLVGWNVSFDVAWLLAYGLETEVFANNWLDGMLLLKRLEPFRQHYDLKSTVAEYFPKQAGYEQGVTYNPQTAEEFKRLMVYAKADVVFTLAIAKQVWGKLPPRERTAAAIEAKCIPDIAQSWIEGITIATDALDELEQHTDEQITTALSELGIDEETLGSPTKLGNVLYQERGFAPEVRTPKGAPSTNKEAITRLVMEHEELRPLLQGRGWLTVRNKFVKGPRLSLAYNGAGRVHPNPRIGGTYTGRLTYSSKQREKADG